MFLGLRDIHVKFRVETLIANITLLARKLHRVPLIEFHDCFIAFDRRLYIKPDRARYIKLSLVDMV